MIRILGKASSINVRKVLWTCAEIQLDYDRQDYGSGFEPTDTLEFLALNPNGLVPVIADETGVLWESNTICRYVATVAARTDLLPADPRKRALVEQWMDWQATELNASWRVAFLGLVRRDPAYSDPDVITASVNAWNRTMGILDRRLTFTGAYATGATFTLADVVLGLSVNRWRMTPMDRPGYPAITAYHERLIARPGYRAHGANGLP
ncbi:glutathione S-transferase [Methylobacterium sp. E-065]|uniref:glutathione S-transferase family protein n=1 Tax=Methylobacterium sp. E-065 TaxID=2836583 RepID=UPI001FBB3522|nr:glutathione S-transferase [Methylobacterium sp. E-065]MCJ2016260.1 glutathione S-transferase [Methylobacterium sp. E-065]